MSAPLRSRILRGWVSHERSRPVRHSFRHEVHYFLFDLDELPELDRRLAGFGHNRAQAISLQDRDYGQGSRLPLRDSIEQYLQRQGCAFRPARIELLTQARVLGYVFNPVSYFFCRDDGGAVRCIVAEVNNTFGDRIRYLLDSSKQVLGTGPYRQPKEMHVSPFMPMGLVYWWNVAWNGAGLAIEMQETEGETPRQGAFFRARLWGKLSPLTSGTLWQAVMRYPLMPVRIMALIHWQALRLYWKGAPFWRRPPYERRML